MSLPEAMGGLMCQSDQVILSSNSFTFFISIVKNSKNLPCVSRIVAFTAKNIDTKILVACLVSWLDS